MRRERLLHRGVHHDRTKVEDPIGRREKIFADSWEKENIEKGHGLGPFDTYCSTLEALMVKDGKMPLISQETATTVATSFQWLATPMGFQFLLKVLGDAGYRVYDVKRR